MYIVEVLPNEVSDLQVSWDDLIPTTLDFIAGWVSFDSSVINELLCQVRDLGLQDEDGISMEDQDGASPSCRQAG